MMIIDGSWKDKTIGSLPNKIEFKIDDDNSPKEQLNKQASIRHFSNIPIYVHSFVQGAWQISYYYYFNAMSVAAVLFIVTCVISDRSSSHFSNKGFLDIPSGRAIHVP